MLLWSNELCGCDHGVINFTIVAMLAEVPFVWVIYQVCSVKMAGYWPSSFLRVYGPRQS